jgi:hypothetical protein
MPRKPSETVQVNLRIKEGLRRRLERESKKRGVSLNYEMTSRIEQSFEQANLRTIDIVAADVAANWLRFAEAFHELNKQGDLMRAAGALVVEVEQLLNGMGSTDTAGVRNAIARVQQVITLIKLEAGLAPQRMHTT